MSDSLRASQAALAERVLALQLSARRVAAGVLAGLHRSVFRGGSAEFAEYKEYAPGDDSRTIDWRLVGRTDRWYVKRFEEATNRRCWLLLDSSASMAFSRGGRESKLEIARLALAGLSALLLGQGDAVGIATLSDDPKSQRGLVPPRGQASHGNAILARLIEASPRGKLSLPESLDALGPVLGRRSLIVIASDLIDDVDLVAAALRRLDARGHEIVVLHVLEPDEIDFPFEGMFRFRDPETGAEVTADAASVRESYRRESAAFLASCERAVASARADLVRLSTDADVAQVLLRFLARRRALARRSAATSRGATG